MNKTELVSSVAEKANLTKKDAGIVVDAFIASVTEAMAKGDKVQLVGFGTFEVRTRAARIGRNPQTGQALKIAEAKFPSFKAGKALKDAVNTKKN